MLTQIDTTAINLVDSLRSRALGRGIHQGHLLQISAGLCAFACATASMSAPSSSQSLIFGVMAVIHCAALLRLLPWVDQIFEMKTPTRIGRRRSDGDLRKSLRALYLCVTALTSTVSIAILMSLPPLWLAIYVVATGSVLLAHALSIYLLANAADH